MEEHNDKGRNEIYSERVRAGKRTYFFDIKSTRSNDYYLTITESKRKYKEDGFTYEKHKIFLYKEDFEKFVNALNQSIDHVKTELLPGVDFNHFEKNENEPTSTETPKTEEATAEVEAESSDEGNSDLKWD
ncbi:MAG: DUF3276 family protein [Cyclobacteriaceae bacterium]